MNDETKNNSNEKSNDSKKEKLQDMRERLAKSMGTSNYFFYLESNIGLRSTRGN